MSTQIQRIKDKLIKAKYTDVKLKVLVQKVINIF